MYPTITGRIFLFRKSRPRWAMNTIISRGCSTGLPVLPSAIFSTAFALSTREACSEIRRPPSLKLRWKPDTRTYAALTAYSRKSSGFLPRNIAAPRTTAACLPETGLLYPPAKACERAGVPAAIGARHSVTVCAPKGAHPGRKKGPSLRRQTDPPPAGCGVIDSAILQDGPFAQFCYFIMALF